MLSASSSSAQLYLPNASFEELSNNDNRVPLWQNCSARWWTNSISTGLADSLIFSFSTPDLGHDSVSLLGPVADGHQCVGMVSNYSNITKKKAKGESMSTGLLCGQLLAGYKYQFNYYARAVISAQTIPPCVVLYIGDGRCDSTATLFLEYHYNTDWEQRMVEFISPVSGRYISIGVDFCHEDSLSQLNRGPNGLEYCYAYLDALSPFVSDTVYNSEHRPIIVEREPCIGDTVVLRSPVDYPGHEAVWLRDGAEVGRGLELRDTLSQPAEYYLLLGEDSCQSLVLRRTIKPRPCREDGLVVFPSAFTPDGDGHNDGYGPAYVAPSVDAGSYRLDIYDRYGSRVYHSIDPHARWMARGYSMGMYIYHVRYEDVYGHPYTQHGELTLLR